MLKNIFIPCFFFFLFKNVVHLFCKATTTDYHGTERTLDPLSSGTEKLESKCHRAVLLPKGRTLPLLSQLQVAPSVLRFVAASLQSLPTTSHHLLSYVSVCVSDTPLLSLMWTPAIGLRTHLKSRMVLCWDLQPHLQ